MYLVLKIVLVLRHGRVIDTEKRSYGRTKGFSTQVPYQAVPVFRLMRYAPGLLNLNLVRPYLNFRYLKIKQDTMAVRIH
eukprot:SAG31_NODE_23229_length_508_cov_1.525672_1_plen_79_part_00